MGKARGPGVPCLGDKVVAVVGAEPAHQVVEGGGGQAQQGEDAALQAGQSFGAGIDDLGVIDEKTGVLAVLAAANGRSQLLPQARSH